MVIALTRARLQAFCLPHVFSIFLLFMPIPVPISGLIFNFQPDFIRSNLGFLSRSISLATGGVSTRPSSVLRWEGGLLRWGSVLWALQSSLTLINLLLEGKRLRVHHCFSKSPFEEGSVSSVPVNRLTWEAVIFGCL